MAAPMIFGIARNFRRKFPILMSVSRLEAISVKRHLLSAAYQCNDVWNERLGEAMLQYDIGDYIIKLNDKAEKGGGITGVDINLFAHRVADCDGVQLETAKRLFYKYRQTQHAVRYLESTPYTMARGYIQADHTDDFVDMLQDKVNYGVFLDAHGAAILMDHFIKQDNYVDASRVAYEMMIQEELDHPLTSLLALYSCHMNRTNPAAAEVEDEVQEAVEEDDDTVTYMRVPFIRNPHYDDHFDLVDENLLLGKTLAVLGMSLGGELGRGYELIGWGYYQKFHKGQELLRRCLDEGMELTEEAVRVYGERLAEVEVVETAEEENRPGQPARVCQETKDRYSAELQELTNSLRQKDLLTTNTLHDMVTDHVTKHLADIEHEQTEQHRQQILSWNETRQQKYQEQCVREANEKRKEEIIQQLRELKEKEELLNYFEMKDEIDLAKSEAPRRKVTTKEEVVEKNVQALLNDGKKPWRYRKERDNRRDHKKENRERYIAMKIKENRNR